MSAFAFDSDCKNGFLGNKWLCVHLTYAFSRIEWQRSKKNASVDIMCESTITKESTLLSIVSPITRGRFYAIVSGHSKQVGL